MKGFVLTITVVMASSLVVANAGSLTVKQVEPFKPAPVLQEKSAKSAPVLQEKVVKPATPAKPAPVLQEKTVKPAAPVGQVTIVPLVKADEKFVPAGRLATVRDRAQRTQRTQRIQRVDIARN